nr:FCD domain-containing protein [Gammaproteobacteria bacterium]NIT17008.1 FCD domain-containing protein [Gammaproteobacteria bacterium]
LVVLTPHRGAQVSMLTAEDMGEAFPVIGALEALAGELACQNATDAEIARIEALHDRMAAAHDARDRAKYFRLNQQIHDALAEAARPAIRR